MFVADRGSGVWILGFSCVAAVHGLLSDLHGDGDFRDATCLGRFDDTESVVDAFCSLTPPPGDGYYYLTRDDCGETSYGRPELDQASPCPGD